MAPSGQKYPRRRQKILCAALAVFATPAMAELAVPSGQDITLHELFLENQETGEVWFRLRYLTPEIARDAGSRTYSDVEPDFLHLCESEALPKLDEALLTADMIVISMMDRVVEFGATDPDATQFFEAFRREDARCIWEGF